MEDFSKGPSPETILRAAANPNTFILFQALWDHFHSSTRPQFPNEHGQNQNTNPQQGNANGQPNGRNTQLVQLVQRVDSGDGQSSQEVSKEPGRATGGLDGGDSGLPFRIARLPLGYTLPAPDLPAPSTNINNQSLLVQLAVTIAKAVGGG
ncbi:hypothetical protein N7519_001149 [Penicillium mononematosum]|uniref:uncharacterized protein n=1 Tax=Penicillium mononematosum TaxID=268346 RepID=UPI002547ADB2|nr:uncharacterized protein N7519_001149 [Penicillium mononematosum]KAJ6191128.1 hypothetical protein N7519_001149 [Penicillium mononematosum]